MKSTGPGRFEVRGLTADAIGDIAAGHGLRLHELAPVTASLESAYLELTQDSVEYAAASTSSATATATTTQRQTLGRAICSEWIKLRTLRSTWIGMGGVVLLLVGLGAIAAAVSTGSVTTSEDGGGFGNGDPLSTVLTGADFAVLLVGVLGALAGAREYGSRMILATIAAVPRRWQVVVSKAVVLTGVVLPTALIGVLAAFGVGMGILSTGDGATVALSDDGILRSVLGWPATSPRSR